MVLAMSVYFRKARASLQKKKLRIIRQKINYYLEISTRWNRINCTDCSEVKIINDVETGMYMFFEHDIITNVN